MYSIMSQMVLIAQPEIKEKMIVLNVNGENARFKCVYSGKFSSLPVKLEKAIFFDMFVDFSRPYSSPENLTPSEILDVEESWREITSGRSRKCTNVEEFLAELKR